MGATSTRGPPLTAVELLLLLPPPEPLLALRPPPWARSWAARSSLVFLGLPLLPRGFLGLILYLRRSSRCSLTLRPICSRGTCAGQNMFSVTPRGKAPFASASAASAPLAPKSTTGAWVRLGSTATLKWSPANQPQTGWKRKPQGALPAPPQHESNTPSLRRQKAHAGAGLALAPAAFTRSSASVRLMLRSVVGSGMESLCREFGLCEMQSAQNTCTQRPSASRLSAPCTSPGGHTKQRGSLLAAALPVGVGFAQPSIGAGSKTLGLGAPASAARPTARHLSQNQSSSGTSRTP
mmetsp:Transcript_35373/g.111281  ORF Transcript_35373/g.111281 Transcript_35373/m.111281 type:complete len:294 (+) Transcript_35373:1739-2620(+)